jgi:hypothetical protein
LERFFIDLGVGLFALDIFHRKHGFKDIPKEHLSADVHVLIGVDVDICSSGCCRQGKAFSKSFQTVQKFGGPVSEAHLAREELPGDFVALSVDHLSRQINSECEPEIRAIARVRVWQTLVPGNRLLLKGVEFMRGWHSPRQAPDEGGINPAPDIQRIDQGTVQIEDDRFGLPQQI